MPRVTSFLISYLFTSEKTFLWVYFSSLSLLLLSRFLSTFYKLDHEENGSELDKRKILLLNQIDKRHGRE